MIRSDYRNLASGFALFAGAAFPIVAGAQSAAPAALQSAVQPAAADPQAGAEADAGEGEVVVTGIRSSLASAASIKRNADSVVDAISAEDIGAFPDQNIAESLQRITGVQITRSKGEGSQATIRGLDPKFTAVLLNGQTLSSVKSQSLSGMGSSRSFDFTILSSDFVSALEVYKSPTADLPDGGVAGTLNIKTIKPLTIGKNRLALNAESIYEEYPDKFGKHFSGLFAGKFLDNRLGIVVGADYSKRFVSTERFDGGGMDKRREGAGPSVYDWNGDGDRNDYYRFSHITAFGIDAGTRERRSAIAGIQFQAADGFDVWYNFLGTQFDNDLVFSQQSAQLQLGPQTSFFPAQVLRSAHVSTIAPFGNDVGAGSITQPNAPPQTAANGDPLTRPNGVPIAGIVDMMDFSNAVLVNNTRTTFNRTRTISHSFGGTIDNGDRWIVDFKASRSSTRDEYTGISLEASASAEYLIDYRTDPGQIPSTQFVRGYDPLNPTNFRITSINGQLRQPIRDTNREGQADFTYKADTGFLKSVQFGVKIAERENYVGQRSVNIAAGPLAAMLGVPNVPLNATSFSAVGFMQVTGGDDYLKRYNGPSTFDRTFLTSNTFAFLDRYSPEMLLGLNGTTVAGVAFPATGAVVPAGGIAVPVTTNLAQTGTVNEVLWAGYVRANFGTPGDRLTGNIGVRGVLTDQHSVGYQADLNTIRFNTNGAQTSVVAGARADISRSYTDILPSLNLKYQATDSLIVRFAAAKTMTRPDLGSLLPGVGSISVVTGQLSDKNPFLDPFRAKQLDLSFEWYRGQDAMLSAAFFYKDVAGYLVNQSDSLTLPVVYVSENNAVRDTIFSRTRPVNGSGGKIKGIELNAQQALSFLPGILGGFGVQANYTYIDADKIAYTLGGAANNAQIILPVPGVSKHSFNLVGYYEKGPVSARVAYNFRSDYMEDAAGSRFDGVYVDSIAQLDASLKVAVNRYLSLTLDATNLTDQPIVRENQYGVARGWEVNGRRINFGARAAF